MTDKKCPYCGGELEFGYIQCRDGVAWRKKKCPVAAFAAWGSSAVSLAPNGGSCTENAAEAYNCTSCKKIIIDYGN